MIEKYLLVLRKNRRIGYTWAAIEGLKKQHKHSFLVVLNQREAIDCKKNGVFIPDNSFLEYALSEAVTEIKKLTALLVETGRY